MFINEIYQKTNNKLTLSLKSAIETITNGFDINPTQKKLKTLLNKEMKGNIFEQSILL